jgi:hypothetical protein
VKYLPSSLRSLFSSRGDGLFQKKLQAEIDGETILPRLKYSDNN